MVKGGEGSGDAPASKEGEMQTLNTEAGNAQIDPRIQTEIGKHLRAIYDDVINEPVPSKFMELLEKLERSSQKS